jgi:hypothetical protein
MGESKREERQVKRKKQEKKTEKANLAFLNAYELVR